MAGEAMKKGWGDHEVGAWGEDFFRKLSDSLQPMICNNLGRGGRHGVRHKGVEA